jgi:hypothetical protein
MLLVLGSLGLAWERKGAEARGLHRWRRWELAHRHLVQRDAAQLRLVRLPELIQQQEQLLWGGSSK